jgi:hypothetical protein
MRFLLENQDGGYVQGVQFTHPSFSDSKVGDIHCYTDANWAGSGCGKKSTSGIIIFQREIDEKWYATEVISRVQQAIALSSCESETYGVSLGLTESLYFKHLVEEENKEATCHITISTDSKSSIMCLKRRGASKRLRHLDTRLFFIQQLLSKPNITIKHVRGEANLADGLTKVKVWSLPEKQAYGICELEKEQDDESIKTQLSWEFVN